ncbi:MAG: efflux RND transporter permease subunit [Planctomycetota bacterium]|nr:efflux RND transporter permease subunit [Planctomycetota bacterium]MDI6787797.1 efflux RND transporter permease subunit [Planctomycetota bacterium]
MLLSEFGVKRAVTNLMLFLGLIVLGVMSIISLPIDLMPEMEFPSISVLTSYRGASAEDVETSVTKHIENDLSIITNITDLTSYSREGMSAVVCRFNWGTNLDEASNEIRERLSFTKMKLPDDADEPIIIKFSTTALPIVGWGVTARESWEKLYEILDKELATSLKQIEGVGAVQLIGGLQRQINVEIDKGKLIAYGISINEVQSAIIAHNYSLPAGSLKEGSNEYAIRTQGEYKDVSEIGETIIKMTGMKIPSPIRLKDIAVIKDDFQDPSGLVYVNENPGMMVFIQKQSGANTNEVCAKVYDKLESIKQRMPSDIQMIEMFNMADFINTTLDNLTQTILFGGVLVIIITFAFLREIRSSFIVALTIPFSLISSFVFLHLWGKTINMMSLASIAIAIGIVVDNAIVVLENIFSHRARGVEQHKAAIIGASEVGLAVTASALSTVVVFIPLIFLKGITGIIFKELGVMVIVTILASLLTALTFTPMLASRLLTFSSDVFQKKKGWYLNVENFYSSILIWALNHKTLTIIIAIVIFIIAILPLPLGLLGSEFFPEEDTGDLRATIELPPGKRMEESLRIGKEAERVFYEVCGKDMIALYTRTGTVGLGGSMMGMKEGVNVVMIGAKLVKVNKRNRSDKEISQEIRKKLVTIPGIVKWDVKSGDPMAQLLTGGGKALAVEVYGDNIDTTNRIAAQIKDIMERTPGTADADISRDIAKPEWKVKIDVDKASTLGLSRNYIANTLRTYFYGRTVSTYREGGREYNIFVRLRPEDRRYIDDVTEALISTPSMAGQPSQNIPLYNIARIEEDLGAIEIERKNQTRVVRVEANLYGRTLGEVSQAVEKEVSKIVLPDGVSIKFGGLVKEQKKSFRDLGFLMILSVFLVYAVMASQFESLLHPFIIIFAVPFGFSGVFLSLFIRGYPISIVSLLGSVILIGVVVNNAIVLVDYINLLRRNVADGGYGMNLVDAVIESGRRRLRPILMTTLTTAFGLLPMALRTGEGTESWRPLGTTILGGLLFSVVVTLILVPVLYAIFNRNKK